jgi:O-antigen/teichoic acid export membrane protein
MVPVNRAVFPAYARIASDLQALRREFLRVFSFIVLVTLPAAAGLVATAPLIVQVVLGPKWTQALPVIQALAVLGMLAALTSNNGIVYLALGRPRIQVILMAAFNVVLLPALIAGSQWQGALGAALAAVAVTVVATPVSFAIVTRQLHVPTLDLLRRTFRPLAASAIMYVVVAWFTAQWLPQAWGAQGVIILAAVVVLGAAIYAVGVILLWLLAGRPGGAEGFFLERAGRELARRFGRT